ncbi:Peptidoglycan hydrolase FlgJ [Vibrio aerogenes CECT 7868]|uniref:Peptidoglycan hydrolase FlgJ n=1 Tax=Vibrio aerogenes CECT 7868 TaxID=1216006 RepID=A0A1M5YKT8_9VIBR|nr:rod-binding protein [Vibrio aerogenes]SHI12570.1 Peptidoglycan hydrolase FlgJ [Vibrio aerogenes CECT 7868]
MKLDGVNDQTQLNSVLYHDNSALTNIKHATNQQESLKTVAGQFEAMFLQLVLRQMRSSSDVLADKDSPFSSEHEGVFRDMYDGQLAIELAKKQKAGIADMLVEQLSPEIPGAVGNGIAQASSSDNVVPLMRAGSQNDSAKNVLNSGPVNPAAQVVASVNQDKTCEVNAISAFAQPLIRKTES